MVMIGTQPLRLSILILCLRLATDSTFAILLRDERLVLLFSHAMTSNQIAQPHLVRISGILSLRVFTSTKLAPAGTPAVLIDIELIRRLLLATLSTDEVIHADSIADLEVSDTKAIDPSGCRRTRQAHWSPRTVSATADQDSWP